MDEQSMWKKEISFRRKPKASKSEEKPEQKVEGDGGTPAEKTSIWKKEISFGRKPKDAEPTEPEGVVAAEAEKEVATEPEPVEDESVWKRAVSFAAKAEQPQEEVVAAEADTVPAGPDQGSEPEPGPEETVWKREVSFSRQPEQAPVEEPLAEEPIAEAPVAAEPVTEEVVAEAPVAEKPVAGKPVAEEPVAEEPVREEPAAEETPDEPVAAEADTVPGGQDQGSDPEPGPEETVWKREVSFSRKPEQTPGPVADEAVAAPEPAPEPQPVPVPVAAAAPVPIPATVVHPPVPAAELPPLPAEAGDKVPFWKKEISLGGKKRDKAPKAERAPRARKEQEPKSPREPKERKEKTPKLKRQRGGGGKGGAKRLVGLKVGASQLAAARVANNGSAELLQVARWPLEPGIVVGGELRDPDALAAALKEFFAEHKLPKRGVRLGISNNRIGVRTFEIAGITDSKQLANAVLFRAQEALPIPIDQAVLDYQVLSEGVDESGQPTRRILLVVAYRELIDRYVDACKKAGITLAGIDLEAFALLRAIQAPQEGVGNDPSAALVAVAIGHDRSTFAVSDGRVCEFTRVLEWGGSALNVALARVLDAAPSEVEGVKKSLSLVEATVPEGLSADQANRAVEAVRKSVQTFARELVSSLQYYQNQAGSLGIAEIVLTGGTAHLPGLAAELESLIGVRVRVGDPLARMKVSKKIGEPEQVGSLAVAIGLGIDD